MQKHTLFFIFSQCTHAREDKWSFVSSQQENQATWSDASCKCHGLQVKFSQIEKIHFSRASASKSAPMCTFCCHVAHLSQPHRTLADQLGRAIAVIKHPRHHHCSSPCQAVPGTAAFATGWLVRVPVWQCLKWQVVLPPTSSSPGPCTMTLPCPTRSHC